MRFPLAAVPTLSYKTGGRGFGASRTWLRPGLLHGACDLIGAAGTRIYAIDSGVVIAGPYDFFRGTSAIEVRHPLFVARYCEIAREGAARAGTQVQEGDVIARIGDQPGSDMLHLELFMGTETGPLTDKSVMPYQRRKDIMDPTPWLDAWAQSLTTGVPVGAVEILDSAGRVVDLQPIEGEVIR